MLPCWILLRNWYDRSLSGSINSCSEGQMIYSLCLLSLVWICRLQKHRQLASHRHKAATWWPRIRWCHATTPGADGSRCWELNHYVWILECTESCLKSWIVITEEYVAAVSSCEELSCKRSHCVTYPLWLRSNLLAGPQHGRIVNLDVLSLPRRQWRLCPVGCELLEKLARKLRPVQIMPWGFRALLGCWS